MQNSQSLALQLAEIQQQMGTLEKRQQALHNRLHAENARRQRRIREDMTTKLKSGNLGEMRAIRPGDPVCFDDGERAVQESWGIQDFDVIETPNLFSLKRRA